MSPARVDRAAVVAAGARREIPSYARIDLVAVRGILENAYERALSILRQRRPALERVAGRLREAEVLDGKQVVALVGGEGRSASAERPISPVREHALLPNVRSG